MKKKDKVKEKAPPDQVKITRLVREIISGRPINQVPDKLLPRVHLELTSAKSRAMKDGLINRIQMIQKVMLDVEQYEKERAKLKSAKSRSKSSFLNREDNSKFSNDDSDDIDAIFEIYQPPPVAVLDSILDDLADGIPFEIAETPNIPYLIDRSKERIDEYLQSGEYFTAQRYENVHIQLVSLMEDRKREKKIENKLNYLTNLLSENQAKLKEIKDEKKRKLDEHEKKVNESLTRSREEYEKANREYDEITNGPLPISARKFSSEYLNLREKERFLIQSRRYEEAASIKAEADRMEARELSMLCDDFIEKREKKKKIIIDKQNKALNCIIENGERTRLRITNEYDQKIQELQRTVENTQNRIKLTDSNFYIEENQQQQQQQQNPPVSLSNLSYLKINNNNDNGQIPSQNIKKNTSKFTLPVPRETTTSKLRSSPFVTQATPQITSPDKSSLNRNKNQNQNQNRFLQKREKMKEKTQSEKVKTQKVMAPQKLAKKETVSFSSESFISSDDDEKKKKNKQNSKISIILNESFNTSSDNNNNTNNSVGFENNNNNNNESINVSFDNDVVDESKNRSNLSFNENSNIDIIDNENKNRSNLSFNENSNIDAIDVVDADENKNRSNMSFNENSNIDVIVDADENQNKSNISFNENSNIDVIDEFVDENQNKSNISFNETSNIDVAEIVDENENDNKNKSNISFNENSNIDIVDENENESKNKSNMSFNENSNIDVVIDDFIVDEANTTTTKNKKSNNADNSDSDDDNVAVVVVVDSSRNKNSEVGKNLIRKKKKNDVLQPNSQLIRNKNAMNHEFHRPVSVQKKMPAAQKWSRSQVRDQPPSPHLYSPNLKAKKKNDKSENPIRTTKAGSRKQ